MQADATILYDPVIDPKKFAVTVQHRSETLILICLLPVQRSSRVFHHHVSRLLYNLIHSLRDYTVGRKSRINPWQGDIRCRADDKEARPPR